MDDFTGMRSGMAVIVEKTDQKRKGVTLWRCVCDCGTEFLTETGKIRSGKVQSCGCYQKELLIESLRLFDNTSVSILETCLNTGFL